MLVLHYKLGDWLYSSNTKYAKVSLYYDVLSPYYRLVRNIYCIDPILLVNILYRDTCNHYRVFSEYVYMPSARVVYVLAFCCVLHNIVGRILFVVR